MGKNTKIIATVIPLSLTSGDLKVAVSLTPRLPDSGKLSEYYEILNWHEHIQFFNPDPDAVGFMFYAEKAINNKPRKGKLIPEPSTANSHCLWPAMFDRQTKVSGWIVDELPYELVETLSKSELGKRVKKAIYKTIRQLTAAGGLGESSDPFAGHGDMEAKRSSTRALVNYLEQLAEKDIALILIDPILTNSSFKPMLAALMDELKQVDQLIKRQMDDLLLRMSVKEVTQQNYEQTAEFHKRFSAYANHPYLLEQTGWIKHYSIKVDDIPDIDQLLFISLITDDTNNLIKITNDASYAFRQEIDFIYPLTAVQFTKPSTPVNMAMHSDPNCFLTGKYEDFVVPDKDEPVRAFLDIDETLGYCRLQGEGGRYEILANLVDKNQVLARVETLLMNNFQETSGDNRTPSGDNNRQKVLQGNFEGLVAELGNGSSTSEYVSNGISVSVGNLKEIIKDWIATSPENDSNPKRTDVLKAGEGVSFIYQHNLMAGYRVDVISYDPEHQICPPAGSLCQRDEYYCMKCTSGDGQIESTFLLGKHENEEPLPDHTDEGWLVESTQGSNSGALYVDEELFRWNDWSLVCSQYGDHNADLDKTGCNDRLFIGTWPGIHSMVPLRFGLTYSFAIRPVDILGNSQKPFHQQPVPVFSGTDLCSFLRGEYTYPPPAAGVSGPPDINDYWTPPVIYQRVDAINSPLLFLGNAILKQDYKLDDANDQTTADASAAGSQLPDWLPARWGEDVSTLVIRSYYQPSKGTLVFEKNNETIRYIGPPKSNFEFAKQHGVFDATFMDMATHAPAYSDAQLEQQKNALLDLAEVQLDNNAHYVLPDQRANFEKIFYLYDPLAAGYEFIIDNIVYTVDRDAAGNALSWYHNLNYLKPDITPLNRITLLPGVPGGPDIDPRFGNIDSDIYLKQGVEKLVTMSCICAALPKPIFLPGIPQTRRTNIKLVHAVQRPCLLNNTYPLSQPSNFADQIPFLGIVAPDGTTTTGTNLLPERFSRVANQAICNFSLVFNLFPILTADSFVLHAEYFNIASNRKNNTGYSIERIRKIIKSGFYPQQMDEESNVLFSDLTHYFEDNKMRYVNYRLEAVSRFKRYFAPGTTPGGFSVYGKLLDWATDDPGDKAVEASYLAAARNWFKIPSTQAPAAPVVEKIVPLISWHKTVKQVERVCDTVRIYLDGDWYSSGPDEKLAVLFMNDAQFNSANVLNYETAADGTTREVSLDMLISQFGNDPSAQNIKFDENYSTILKIKDDSFDHSCTGFEQILPDTLPIASLDFEKPKESLTGSLAVKAAIFGIAYNKPANDDGKFFVDVRLHSDKVSTSYFPFVRFAIARYQENAINHAPGTLDVRFSKVVVTDFVQLLPHRILDLADNKINYTAPSVRKINEKHTHKDEKGREVEDYTYSILNQLYVYKEDAAPGVPQIFNFTVNDALTGKEVTPGQADYTPAALPEIPYIIAEYESYQNPNEKGVNELVPDEKDPRKDYTKRLIFSYLVAETSAAVKTKADEKKD